MVCLPLAVLLPRLRHYHHHNLHHYYHRFLMFIVGLHLRCWVDCKNGVGVVAVIIHSCGIFNATISSSGSSGVVGFKYLGLHGNYRAWDVFLQEHSWYLSG